MGRSANEGLGDDRWLCSVAADPRHLTRHAVYAPQTVGLAYDFDLSLTGPHSEKNP